MTKNRELLDAQTSANTQDSEKSHLAEYQFISGTMFTAVKINGKWRIMMGNNQISNREFELIEALKAYLKTKPWEVILNAAYIFIEAINNAKMEKQNNG